MKLHIIILTVFFMGNAVTIRTAARGPKVNYEGYKVYKVTIENEEQRTLIRQLAQTQEFSIWHEDRQHIDLMANPEQQLEFQNVTLARNIRYFEMISNLQSLIREEEQASEDILNDDDDDEFVWTRYNNLTNIENFLDRVLSKYPSVTEQFIIGKSFEGRTIRGIKISYKSDNPGVFIESNIHAREWITSATATWFINELLSSSDSEIRYIAENYDWYIVPVLNVDGFVYSHDKDRLWRKTRQPVAHSDCIGTDGNRNFDSHWMANGGASDDPCAFDYAGPYAFSEPEIKGLADYLLANKYKINILLAFHSYSQVVLSPWGHTFEVPPNYADLMQVAKAYAVAVGTLPYETAYTYGTSSGEMYLASGATIEYAYNELDIKLTYTIEMRDTGKYGFVLPPIHILPNCEETMIGMVALLKEANTLGYLQVK